MIKNILKGIKAYFGSLKLISKLKLWKYFAIPMIISFVTALVIGFSAYGLSDNIGDFMLKLLPWGIENSWIKNSFYFISGLITLVIGLVLYKHIILALSAPFMSPVSEKIEAHLTGNEHHNHRNTTFQSQLWRGIKINIRNLFKELLFTIPLLILGFIPVIGIIFVGLSFIIQAYYVGFGNMDYTLERHFNYKESIRFVGKHKGLAIGNGLVFMLFLFIPIIGIILVLPFSVTAATSEVVKILEAEK